MTSPEDMPGLDNVRPLKPGEEPAVDLLLRAAFPGPEEAGLVCQLRTDGDMAQEKVLEWEGRIIGYFALSSMVAPQDWLCLAPVAVHPDWQRKGQGRMMMGLLCEWAKTAGRYVVVLGQVGFYQSGGFSLARAARLTSPYPIRNTLLAGPDRDVPVETLQYARAFDGL